MRDRAVAMRRLLAFSVDWLVVVLWGGVMFGVVTLAAGGVPPRPDSPWTAQGIGLLSMTLPVTLYFAASEWSAWRGSLGKKVFGLAVADELGGRLGFGAALLRNAAKFAPWELGHTVAQQAIFSGQDGLPGWVVVPATAAFAGPVWWIVSIAAWGRAPYDRWAGARVGRASADVHRGTYG